jgi:hypothetical protein
MGIQTAGGWVEIQGSPVRPESAHPGNLKIALEDETVSACL